MMPIAWINFRSRRVHVCMRLSMRVYTACICLYNLFMLNLHISGTRPRPKHIYPWQTILSMRLWKSCLLARVQTYDLLKLATVEHLQPNMTRKYWCLHWNSRRHMMSLHKMQNGKTRKKGLSLWQDKGSSSDQSANGIHKQVLILW